MIYLELDVTCIRNKKQFNSEDDTYRDCSPRIPNPGISGLKKMYFSVENNIYSMIFAINY